MVKTFPVRQIASVSSGTAVTRASGPEGDARAVMVGDLGGSGRLAASLPTVVAPKSAEAARLRPGDVVVSLRGTSNLAACVEGKDVNGPPLFATLDVAVIRLAEGAEVDPGYLAIFLNMPSTQRSFESYRSGTGALRLPIGPLRELRVPIPPRERQQVIVALARAAAEEQALMKRLGALRTDYINQLLRQAAAEGPAPG